MAALTTSAAPEKLEIVGPDLSLPPDFCLSNFFPAPLGLCDLFKEVEDASSSSDEDGGL